MQDIPVRRDLLSMKIGTSFEGQQILKGYSDKLETMKVTARGFSRQLDQRYVGHYERFCR